ncbi:hypothetical protein GCM10007989_29950 [Devosia pacifica]|uniref:Flp pilus assembly protein TadD n=1 Tax=Devosia pacifica TaxID=1335967 RepID=A0A918SCA2_9HYPH|nr:tetratricopeptide repeat protein [Devosia pacifica]GHA31894.1 hypothetical protein GCM10007989_29950 [Devosia pacifica]
MVSFLFSMNRFLAGAGVALMLAGCASAPVDDQTVTGSTAGTLSVSGLAERYRDNPNDRGITLAYSKALRDEGLNAQAANVLERGVASNPRDTVVRIAYAKALTAEGRFSQALNVIDAAIDPTLPNWNALSVKGAILDQLGNHQAARQTYREALVIAPDQASLEANLGLSYSLTNELETAEEHLRKAAAMSGATSQIRQNLALVVGLQGRFSEAEQLYARELSAQEVEANMAYVRGLLSENNRWQQIENGAS